MRNVFDWISAVFLIIGGLNWGLLGIFSFNLVETLFSAISWLPKVVYIIVGLSALYTIFYVIRGEE